MQLPSSLPQVVLETPRLLLKELNPAITDHIYTSWTDAQLSDYLGITEAELAAERENYRKGLTTFRLSFKHFLLVHKATDIVIGKAGFHSWHLPHARAEIGYSLFIENVKQQGYMTEALAAILAYGFDELKLNRIEAFASPRNEPSMRLLQRFGFTREGLLREHYFKNGRMEDSACFGLLRSEYYGIRKEIKQG